jgi:hypothetical protein
MPMSIPTSELDLAVPLDPEQTIKAQCPICRTRFDLKAGESVVVDSTHWSSEGRPAVGTLSIEIRILIEHTCPEGTVIRRKSNG